MVASPSPNDPSAHLANLQIDRLVGFDTPERGDSARCEDERWRAEAATTRLRQLIAAGNARLQRVACACRPGEEGTSRCNYGRLCGSLTVGGRDVGQILIGEGWRVRMSAAARAAPAAAVVRLGRGVWCD
jgi:endonuclease YncB( thermonuclease family)